MKKLRLRHDTVRASVPDGRARFRDQQPDGRWELLEDCEEFRKGSKLNGYNLECSRTVLPDGITYKKGNKIIRLLKKHWFTEGGELTDPRLNE